MTTTSSALDPSSNTDPLGAAGGLSPLPKSLDISASSSATATSGASGNQTGGGSFNGGSYISGGSGGIGVGIILAVVAVIGGLWYFLRRKG